jgi:hypothetical protein
LAKDQTNSVDNGIWVASTASWTRDLDFDGTNDVTGGTLVPVFVGTVNGGSTWRVTSTDTPILPGTTSMTFAGAVSGNTVSAPLTLTQNSASILTFQNAATGQDTLTIGVRSAGTGGNISYDPTGTSQYPLKITNTTGGIELSVTAGANANVPKFAISDGGSLIEGPGGVFYGGFGASGGPGAGAQGITFNLIANQDSATEDANCAIYRVYGRGNSAGADDGVECYTARGTFAAPTASLSGDLLGKFDAIGYNGSDWNPNFQGRISVYADQDMTATHGGGAVVIQTNIKDTLDADVAAVWDSSQNTLLGKGWLTGGNTVSGSGVVVIKDAATNPTASVSGAGILYSSSGVPHWRASGGSSNQFIVLQNGNVTADYLTAWSGDGSLKNAGNATMQADSTGSSVEPKLTLYHNQTGTPAQSDFAGQIVFSAKNSATAQKTFAQIIAKVETVTSASEDGIFQFNVQRSGTNTTALQIGGAVGGGGVLIGNPTGGDKGLGTINAAGDIYKNNTAYTNPDYVFEKFYTGNIVQFADREGASGYGGLMTLGDLEQYARDNLRLPGITDDPAGLFKRGDIILEKVEEAYLYLFQLAGRISALEAKAA